MTGKEAVEYIHSVSWLGSRPGLDRIRELLSRMGNPERALKCIHVAGTNGKGSVCAMLAAILKANGLKTGLFTSPYVEFFNERIQINGEMIADEALGEVTEYVKSYADGMSESPTEFELLTAIGFEYFKREAVDVVVLETGLGGRLDSTNVIEEPLVSVITGIALDHTAVLGNTTREIAREKSGIIKKSRPVVVGEMDSEALDVIKTVAEENASPVYSPDRTDVRYEYSSLAGSEFVYKNKTKYSLALIGDYQISNALVVLKTVEALRDSGFTVHDYPVKLGLEQVRWPARFELLSKIPPVIYDGAHNPQGVSATAKILKRFFGEHGTVVVTGMMEDKDHGVMTSIISEIAVKVHTVTPSNPRSMKAQALAAEFSAAGTDAVAHDSFDSALTAAVADARELNVPVAALGSLYMYADVKHALGKVLENEKNSK